MYLSAAAYGLAYLTAALVFVWMARRRGMATSGVMMIMQAGLIGGLVFANAAQWLLGGQPGKTVLGGIAGGYFCVWLVKRRLGLRRPTGDLFAVAICAGEAIGRIGCFLGGCCYGRPTNVPWAVWQHGAWRHPTQLYLSAACLIILAVLWMQSHRRPPEDALFCLQGLLYCLARFGVEFLRVSPAVVAGLTAAQWACVGGVVFFGVKGWMLARNEQMESLAYAQA